MIKKIFFSISAYYLTSYFPIHSYIALTTGLKPINSSKVQNKTVKAIDKFYNDIYKQNSHLRQKIKHFIIFRFGIFPFVRNKGNEYQGVIYKWKKQGIKVLI